MKKQDHIILSYAILATLIFSIACLTIGILWR